MNKCELVGHLVRDPETRIAQSGTEVCRFTVAVNRRFKKEGEQQADFPGCIAFGKTAQFIQKYFTKGKAIGIVGRIQTGKYEKDGRTVYTTDVIVDEAEFVGRKDDSAAPAPSTYTNSVGETKPIPGPPPVVSDAGLYAGTDPDFEPIDDAELPF